MKHSLCIILCLSACAPEYNTTHDEPQAGRVAVHTEALTQRSCSSVMGYLQTPLKTCLGCCAAGGGSWCAYGQPAIYRQGQTSQQYWALTDTSAEKAKQKFCAQMTNGLFQSSTIPVRKINLTGVVVTYP